MGTVLEIQLGPARTKPMVAVDSIRVVAGKGIEGDRFFKRAGTYEGTGRLGAGREITLIELSSLRAVKEEHDIELAFAETRRNILVEGIALNDLVGKEFRVGAVTLRGMRLCEPCRHLSELTGKELVRALCHRGGLNAQAVTTGTISRGDAITTA